MRKLMTYNFIIQLIALVILIVAYHNQMEILFFLTVLINIFYVIIMMIPTNEIKWWSTREDMLKAQKKSETESRNVSKLIDKIKRELFKKHIMTKEEVLEILDKE